MLVIWLVHIFERENIKQREKRILKFDFLILQQVQVRAVWPVTYSSVGDNQHFERTYCHTLYAFFWALPRRLNFICRRFGTLCSIFIGVYVYLIGL
jgi:hypothetical protein